MGMGASNLAAMVRRRGQAGRHVGVVCGRDTAPVGRTRKKKKRKRNFHVGSSSFDGLNLRVWLVPTTF